MEEDIILIDKPSGMTSFDVIRELRKKLDIRKLGHAGTLDPLATGLLIIGVGEGTKKMGEFLKLPKSYEAEILLGVKTDTGDTDGKVLEEREVHGIDEGKIKKELASLIGENKLPVPVYSAVKQGGKPLYVRARRGERVDPPVKTMVVHDAQLVDVKEKSGKMFLTTFFNVESGVYIRSLAEAFGERLGVPTTISALRRTRIGKYTIESAKKLEEI